MFIALHLKMQNRHRANNFAVANSLEKTIAPDFGNENRNPGLFHLSDFLGSIEGGDAIT